MAIKGEKKHVLIIELAGDAGDTRARKGKSRDLMFSIFALFR
jgi:hypothetical protein